MSAAASAILMRLRIIKKLVSVIKKQKADIICINDANTAIDFERAKTQISTAFSALFPDPSSFEKGQ